MKTILTLALISTSLLSYAATSEFDKFFDDLIQEQEREVSELRQMRKEFLEKGEKEKFSLREEIGRLQAELRHDFRRVADKIKGVSVSEAEPKIEMKEGPDAYEVKAEVPGIGEKDVKVVVQGNDLIISGSREEKVETKKAGKSISEFEYGEFKRQIHFGKKVDPNSLRVNFDNGIVNVHVNKSKG